MSRIYTEILRNNKRHPVFVTKTRELFYAVSEAFKKCELRVCVYCLLHEERDIEETEGEEGKMSK